MPGLVGGRRDGPGWTMAWSAGERAPLDTWWGADGSGALVLGDAIDGASGRLGAEHVAGRFAASDDPARLQLDGYHAAVVAGPGDRAVVTSDVLGLYPVYWARTDRGLVVSSTPAAFVGDPGAATGIDAPGLAGLLSIHGTVGQRTIVPGVRRLPAGHALVSSSGADAAVRALVLPDEETHAGADPARQDELLYGAVAGSLRAHLPPDDPVGLLLTGGRDSRMLAGRLIADGRTVVARTVGRPDDFEVRLARRVARTLACRHDARALPASAMVDGVRTHVRVDHLASGAAHAYWWSGGAALADLPARTVTGHLFDVVVGGLMRYSGLREHGMDMPWEQALPFERRAGIDPDLLASLRTPDRDEALAWAADTLRDSYLEHPTHQRLWRWMLGHYCRFHVGSVLRPISYRTWPVVPVLDRALLALAASLDSRAVANRQGQDRMLLRYHPALSRIPHVFENAEPAVALRHGRLHRLAGRVRDRIRKPAEARRRRDRRFIWRNTDFGGAGWVAVREMAEPLRPRLHELFDPDRLDAYLPPPQGALAQRDFSSHQGPKLLVALALWLDHVGM